MACRKATLLKPKDLDNVGEYYFHNQNHDQYEELEKVEMYSSQMNGILQR